MKDIGVYREQLQKELQKITEELKSVGRINPSNPADWEPIPEKMDTQTGAKDEKADIIENYEENTAILKQLEIRFNNLKKALERIENGTYGICQKCGKPIDEERLEANPAATVCSECLKKEN
jgi:RNA polymerase-binding transcription factor DksA